MKHSITLCTLLCCILSASCSQKPKSDYTVVFLYGGTSFINNGSQIKFKYTFNDTIYVVSDHKLIPDMVLNLGAGRANENARREALYADPRTVDLFKDMDRVYLQGENDRYVYLLIDFVPLFYDKKEQQVHKWQFSLPDDKRIDPEQAKKFVPICIDKNGNMIGTTPAADQNDNPVIIIAKLKR